jgi:Ser/Thr protein kinase RdoA (MazF antagonist)
MDNHNLITLYQQRLNLQNATFSRIDHEDAMVAIVYKVTLPNGKQLILKVCDRVNDYLREVHFLNHFRGILPVPKIVQHILPRPGLHGAILMEYLPGALLKIAELTETLAYQIGRCLAQIHLSRLSGYGDPVHGDLSSDPRVYFTLKFEEGLDECRDHLPIELMENCQRYYSANIDLLSTVDRPCIVHRDFRPGNLIVYESQLKGIIDWAGARASFAEEDLCSLEHYEWSNNPHSIKPLLAGYASVRQLPDYIRLVPFLRLNKAIATIGFTVRQGTWENRHSRIYRYNRQFLEQLFEANL